MFEDVRLFKLMVNEFVRKKYISNSFNFQYHLFLVFPRIELSIILKFHFPKVKTQKVILALRLFQKSSKKKYCLHFSP